jgi:integrase
VKKPKTAKSVRPVALPKTLRDELEAWWKESSYRDPGDYVFASSTGTPLDGRGMIRDVFEPARKKAKLPAVRFHDLRHSYASILIAQGEHPKVISEQLGHASVTITMDRYSHLFDRAWTDVSDSLERAWKGTETAHIPAHIARANGAAAFHKAADAETEIPANATVSGTRRNPITL